MGQFKMYEFHTSRKECLGSLHLSTQKLSGSYCQKGIHILYVSRVCLSSPIRRREKSWISMFIKTPFLFGFVLFLYSLLNDLIAECLQEATTASREGRIFSMFEPCWSWFQRSIWTPTWLVNLEQMLLFRITLRKEMTNCLIGLCRRKNALWYTGDAIEKKIRGAGWIAASHWTPREKINESAAAWFQE